MRNRTCVYYNWSDTIVKKTNVLITGGAGFIGANLVRHLHNKKFQVHIISKSTTNLWRLKNMLTHVILHDVSLMSKSQLTKTVKKINPYAIFHLAAHGAYSFQTNVEEMVKINILGTLNLLYASKDINYKIFVNTGSSSEFGFKKDPMKETDILEPNSFYSATKASSTHLCQVFAKEFDKPIVTLRPFSVYGPYEESKRFIPTIIKNLLQKNPIKVTPGKQKRDFIYIDDMIHAYICAVKKGAELQGKICNIGTGKEYSNDKIVQMLFKVAKQKVPIQKGAYPTRTWDTPHWVSDISHTKRCLNWKPKYNIEEGLIKTYTWFKNNYKLYEKTL